MHYKHLLKKKRKKKYFAYWCKNGGVLSRQNLIKENTVHSLDPSNFLFLLINSGERQVERNKVRDCGIDSGDFSVHYPYGLRNRFLSFSVFFQSPLKSHQLYEIIFWDPQWVLLTHQMVRITLKSNWTKSTMNLPLTLFIINRNSGNLVVLRLPEIY